MMAPATSPSEISLMRAPTSRTWSMISRLPVAVQDDDDQVAGMQPLRLRDPAQVPVHRHLDVDHAPGPAAHHQLLHVVDVGGEHRAALGQGDHGQRAGLALGGEAGAVDRVHGHVHLGLHAVADLLAEVQHRRLVLLTLPDHDGPEHVHGGQRRAHRVHGALVQVFMVAPALQRRGRERRLLGHPQQLEGQVAIQRWL